MKIESTPSVIGQYNKIKTDAVRPCPQNQSEIDRVDLSQEAQIFTEAFSAVKKSMQETLPGQELRVNQIMEQMRNGTYEVEVKDICNKLLP